MKNFHEQKWYRIARIVVCLVLVLAAAYVVYGKVSGSNDEKEIVYQQNSYDYLDELYANKDYKTLMDYVLKSYRKGHDLSDWEHYEFCSMYNLKENIDFWRDDVLNGRAEAVAFQWLFYDEWCLIGQTYAHELDEQEIEEFGAYIEQAKEDMANIFELDQKAYDAYVEKILANDYFITFEECEIIINDWLASKK